MARSRMSSAQPTLSDSERLEAVERELAATRATVAALAGLGADKARWLAQHFSLHSMIDLSDGLAGDLRQIVNASRVGAEILTAALPVSRAAKLAARGGSSAKPAAAAALTDGEDFELLFTVAGKDAVKLLDAWKPQFPKVKLSCIGKIVSGEGIFIRDKTGSHQLKAHGYVHFP